MRLIDADALIARVESDIKVIEDIEPQMAMGAIGVLNTIKKAPTEDVKACKEQKSKLESEKVQLSQETSTNRVDTSTNTSTDLISRQAAIELACWRCKKCERKDCEYKDSCETMSLLEALPSEDPKPPVEPKRPKGEWIVYPLAENGRVELECPECGDTFIRAIDYRPHFCENCGADMRGEE